MTKFLHALFAIVLLTPLPARAADLGSARTFTERLYQAYGRGDPEYLDAGARKVFASHLLDLIRRDKARTPAGDVGTLDWDPICSCQDTDGMKVARVDITKGSARSRAHAVVSLRFASEAETVKLDLVASKGGWRIADIHTKDTPSLVALLEKSLR
jgi:hypothetical protein